MPEIYVIVADSSQVRVLYACDKSNPLQDYHVLEHPEGRQHARELTTDLPGHSSNHTGSGKHSFDSATEPKQVELEKFAKEISEYLKTLSQTKKVDQFMLLASPSLLGSLRPKLSPQVKELIKFELDKNLVHLKNSEIRSFIPWFKNPEVIVSS